MRRALLIIAVFLVINPTCTEAIGDMNVCFILDGILIIYGIILTVLYCRLRMSPDCQKASNPPEKQPTEGGIYAGLTSRSTDTYETIKVEKKPIV
ncbi:Fc receptor, IgE, high affinity I, gamma polypeptide like isoform X3 [Centropristis striata]|uniref:Fc receptor, IgE, high affinity I, gamma polypeptide like isoform X3 n=1 Tax=Centropristis striata TaxID=184440 RepID=UPI0027DF5803|nr:Fc receptor, IgE, high affinity I, gamma polypeptide like isoform X3 [Centropristis striata]